jgi:hypothetical protein
VSTLKEKVCSRQFVIGAVVVLALLLLVGAALAVSNTFTTVTPANLSYYKSSNTPIFNITLSAPAVTCTAYYNNGTISSYYMTGVNATGGDGAIGGNVSFNYSGSYFNSPHQLSNLTFYCVNASTASGPSWLNTSTSAGFIYFGKDTVSPVLNDFATLPNVSVWGNSNGIINITIPTTEINPYYCYMTIYGPSSTAAAIVNGTMTSEENSTCYMNLTAPNGNAGLTGNGFFKFEKHVVDLAGNTGNAVNYVNQSGFVYTPYTGRWNLIGTYGNETFGTICNRIPNATYISWYNNTYHNFTTYTCGASTNKATTVWDGAGVYVAVAKDITAYNLNTTKTLTAPAQYIQTNWSSTDGPWNIVGVYNPTGRTLDTICYLNTSGLNFNSIYYVSYHSVADGVYYTHPCGTDYNNVTAPAGSAVWVAVRNSTTYTRGGIVNFTIAP